MDYCCLLMKLKHSLAADHVSIRPLICVHVGFMDDAAGSISLYSQQRADDLVLSYH
jgi:hypothetical protein